PAEREGRIVVKDYAGREHIGMERDGYHGGGTLAIPESEERWALRKNPAPIRTRLVVGLYPVDELVIPGEGRNIVGGRRRGISDALKDIAGFLSEDLG